MASFSICHAVHELTDWRYLWSQT